MNEVFLKTRELGEAILRSDVYQTMRALEESAMHNEEAALTMAEYMEKKQLIESLLLQENPDLDQLKVLSDDLDALKEKLTLIGDVQALTEARDEFSNLIEEVNKVLRFIVTGDMGASDDECSGGCDSCKGCGHLH